MGENPIQNQNQVAPELENDNGELETKIGGFNFSDEESKKAIQTEIARKKHWREKAIKEKAENQRLVAELATLKKPEETKPLTPPAPAQSTGLDIMEVLKLRKEGFSDEEIIGLADQATALKVPVSTILSNPIFKSGIEAERSKKKAGQATPSPSSRSFIVNGKTWAQMNEQERKANFEALSNRGRGANE